MKYHSDYYNYELVGIVVHSGTADSGHYYSYIKEQERFDSATPEKWYEFNDTFVRDFDKNEIPNECYGGVEQSVGWGTKGYVKTANAYIVVYKRKMEEVPLDSDDESAEKT
jgi:ubiquitin carboxyl-terminal hydrolase 34